MKKMVAVLVMGLVAMSYGNTQVNWAAGAGFYFTVDPFTGLLGAPGSGNSTKVQLMYSSDNSKDDINLSLAGNVNDVVWDTQTITENGSGNEWANFSFSYVNAGFTAGYVYALIFQDNNVQVGDWYYYTPMLALVNLGGLDFPQDLAVNTDPINGNAIDSITGGGTSTAGLVAQVVPEPATFGLMALGGIGAWLLRRNKLKSKEEADA